MGKLPLTVGALLRRDVRRALDRAGIEYTEDKGWFDSQFIVTVNDAQRRAIGAWVASVNAEDTE